MVLKPLLLTLGDPCGIGPEITIKAWEALKNQKNLTFAIIAPPDIITQAGGKIQTISHLSEASKVFRKAIPVISITGSPAISGQPSKHHAKTITSSIETAAKMTLKGHAAGIVTNPIAKDILYEAGFKFPGHTEYLAKLTMHETPPYPRGPVMMLTGGDLRVGLATIHMALKQVLETISLDIILTKSRVIHAALQCDFGIKNPRISLAGLNPHAGEGGALGREEIEIINPAADILQAEGLNVSHAQSADTLFHTEARQNYDAVLAMYHDQGLIPVKTLDFHGGVNVTLGLPVVRTSPDHGTAFNIAGQNIARPDSLIAAIKLARSIANNRATFTRNPHVSG